MPSSTPSSTGTKAGSSSTPSNGCAACRLGAGSVPGARVCHAQARDQKKSCAARGASGAACVGPVPYVARVGFLRELFTGNAEPLLELARTASAPAFAVDSEAYPPGLIGVGTTAYADGAALAPRIDRARAIQVGAVKRARDLIPGVLATLPLELFGADKRPTPWPLFEQPEPNRPRSVTMADTFEDMFFERVAWWRVKARAWNGWPTSVDYIRPGRVAVDESRHTVHIDGREVVDADLIRFHGPTDGLLIAGGRAIRTCLLLDAAAALRADGVPPVEYFTPADGADPADDDDVTALLSQWQAARRTRSAAYIPAALKYNADGVDPDKLQLNDARQQAVLEIARHAGIDPEDLGVSTTSRTYQNGFERRKALIDFTYAPYMVAAQDTLTMRNVTPRGYTAAFNIDGLLRADPLARFNAYKAGLEVGAITPERIAEIEGIPAANVRALPAAPAEPTTGTARAE